MRNFKLIIYVFSFLFMLSGCAKKYDWACSCEIYTATTTDVRTKDITNKSQSDANEECNKFGENEAGLGGAHDCNTKVK